MITKQQWMEIEQLERICNKLENIQLKLNWDMLRTRKPDQQDDYIAIRDERIVGFLGLYHFGKKMEVCGMVHPEYRRQGIFTSLLGQALPQAKRMQYHEILLNAPANSASAKGFLSSLQVEYSFSEYQMTYYRQNTEAQKAAHPENEPAILRQASPEDRADLTALDVKCFDYSEFAAEQYYEATINEPDSVTYIIESGGSTAGKVRLVFEDTVSWIYGFAIYPKFRGQGIGRYILTRLIAQETAAGRDLRLEVALNNPRAMKLYESVGFIPTGVQDYYLYPPANHIK
ncbi:GNAT family N-acetyltransferase [Paenibacillus tuaregi]|uniref:GNAT family N-acetyltransferase n=1 Tax=Paenibacillus tuaregi TaxID=1816681 RepID=UPI0008391179|nr:GNAT family N-acetyltransferase [Paenibacillus tuaregi]